MHWCPMEAMVAASVAGQLYWLKMWLLYKWANLSKRGGDE